MCTRSINSGSSLSWQRKLMISFMVPTKPDWSGLVLSTQNLSYNSEFVNLPSWYRPLIPLIKSFRLIWKLHGVFSNGRLHPTKAAFLGYHVIKRRWRPSQSEGSLEDSLHFASKLDASHASNLKDAWDVSSATFNHPQSFVPIPYHENKLTKKRVINELVWIYYEI